MHIGVLMNPLAGINIEKDSTFVLMLEAQKRGATLYYFTPDDLYYQNGAILAEAAVVTVQRSHTAHYQLGKPQTLPLASFDIVLMRQDPPFDMAYITATYLLEQLPPSVRVLNNPAAVRSAPEKILPPCAVPFAPPTLITRNRRAIEAFRREHQNIIIKPLYGCGGSGVFHLPPDAPNLGVICEVYGEKYVEPLIVQRYLPEIAHGDKRIILINGNPIGAVSRMPDSHEHRANFHAGGRAAKATLSQREIEMCAALKPWLQEQGLFLAGIDSIGGYLTEINVTSPTGFQEINALDGICCEALFWDAVTATTP